MSIVQNCLYDESEKCKYEIFVGEPNIKKCKFCNKNSVNKRKQVEEVNMFEKEVDFAETKMLVDCKGDYSKKKDYKKGWQDGAEFGYNKAKVEVEEKYKETICNSELNLASVTEQLEELEKANEWHFVKDGDLPNKELEEKQLLVRVRNYTEDFILAYYMLDKYYSKNGKRFYFDIDCDTPINTKDIIAWKEIVLPELPKEE